MEFKAALESEADPSRYKAWVSLAAEFRCHYIAVDQLEGSSTAQELSV
jgi:hypothetical protein